MADPVKTYKTGQTYSVKLKDTLVKVKIVHVLPNGCAIGASAEQAFKFDKVGGVTSLTDATECTVEPEYRWLNIYRNSVYTTPTRIVHRFNDMYYDTEELAMAHGEPNAVGYGQWMGSVRVEV